MICKLTLAHVVHCCCERHSEYKCHMQWRCIKIIFKALICKQNDFEAFLLVNSCLVSTRLFIDFHVSVHWDQVKISITQWQTWKEIHDIISVISLKTLQLVFVWTYSMNHKTQEYLNCNVFTTERNNRSLIQGFLLMVWSNSLLSSCSNMCLQVSRKPKRGVALEGKCNAMAACYTIWERASSENNQGKLKQSSSLQMHFEPFKVFLTLWWNLNLLVWFQQRDLSTVTLGFCSFLLCCGSWWVKSEPVDNLKLT